MKRYKQFFFEAYYKAGEENTLDTIEDLEYEGADVDNNGFVTLYHFTSLETVDLIRKTKYFISKEDGIFFTTNPKGQALGYGQGMIKVKIHASLLKIDDLFGNEAHVTVPLKKAGIKFTEFKLV